MLSWNSNVRAGEGNILVRLQRGSYLLMVARASTMSAESTLNTLWCFVHAGVHKIRRPHNPPYFIFFSLQSKCAIPTGFQAGVCAASGVCATVGACSVFCSLFLFWLAFGFRLLTYRAPYLCPENIKQVIHTSPSQTLTNLIPPLYLIFI